MIGNRALAWVSRLAPGQTVLTVLFTAGTWITLVGEGVGVRRAVLTVAITLSFVVGTIVIARAEVRRRAREIAGQAATELSTAATKLEDLRETLRATLTENVDVREIQRILVVLDAGRQDHYRMEVTTRVVGVERCRWRRIVVNSNQAGSDGVTARLIGGQAVLIDLESRKRTSWEGIVLFDPPIEANTERSWALDLTWEGMADPLREYSEDALEFYTEVPVDEATLAVVYPLNWTTSQHPTSFKSCYPMGVGETVCEVRDGTTLIEWRIPDPLLTHQYKAILSA